MEPIVKSKYSMYLESEEFADLRSKVFRRDNNKCRACGSTETLQAHHLSYRNIYHETPEDLVCLCRRCHAAFHAVDEMRKLYEELHANEQKLEIEEQQKKFQNDRARIEKLEAEIVEEIKEEFAEQDYAKNGDLNMTEWSVLNPIIENKCKEKEFDGWFSKRMEIRDWFLYRRYELLLRCLDKGLSFETVRNQTKFDSGWLFKWYNRDKLAARLNQENFIKNIKEETT